MSSKITMENKMGILKVSLILPLISAGFLLFGNSAEAQTTDFTFTLDEAYQVASPGETVGFTATVTNTGSTDLYLPSDSFQVASPLAVDDSPFGNFPPTPPPATPYNGYLAPSGTYSTYDGLLFNVDVPLGTSGLYSGSFTINGLADGDVNGLSVTQDFNVYVQSVPEGGASSLYLLLAGVVCFGVMVLRARKARKASASA
jgi:hypothetical protein